MRSVAMLAAMLPVLAARADAAGPLPPTGATALEYGLLALVLCVLPLVGFLLLLFLRWALRKLFRKGRAAERNVGCVVCSAIFLCYLVAVSILLVWQFVGDYREAERNEPEWFQQRREQRRRRFEERMAPATNNQPHATDLHSNPPAR